MQQNVAMADTAPKVSDNAESSGKSNCVSVSRLTVDIKVYLGFDFIGPILLKIRMK